MFALLHCFKEFNSREQRITYPLLRATRSLILVIHRRMLVLDKNEGGESSENLYTEPESPLFSRE